MLATWGQRISLSIVWRMLDNRNNFWRMWSLRKGFISVQTHNWIANWISGAVKCASGLAGDFHADWDNLHYVRIAIIIFMRLWKCFLHLHLLSVHCIKLQHTLVLSSPGAFDYYALYRISHFHTLYNYVVIIHRPNGFVDEYT